MSLFNTIFPPEVFKVTSPIPIVIAALIVISPVAISERSPDRYVGTRAGGIAVRAPIVIELLTMIAASAIKVSEFAPVYVMFPLTVMSPVPPPVLVVEIVTEPKPKAVINEAMLTVAVSN
jgi:hypothetical protein